MGVEHSEVGRGCSYIRLHSKCVCVEGRGAGQRVVKSQHSRVQRAVLLSLCCLPTFFTALSMCADRASVDGDSSHGYAGSTSSVLKITALFS